MVGAGFARVRKLIGGSFPVAGAATVLASVLHSRFHLIDYKLKVSEDLIKGNPAMSGGSLQSIPTWMRTLLCSFTSVFLFFLSLASR